MKTSDSRHTSRMTAKNFGTFWSKLFWIKLGISSKVLYENQLHKNVTEMFNSWKKNKRNSNFWLSWVSVEINYSKYHCIARSNHDTVTVKVISISDRD